MPPFLFYTQSIEPRGSMSTEYVRATGSIQSMGYAAHFRGHFRGRDVTIWRCDEPSCFFPEQSFHKAACNCCLPLSAKKAKSCGGQWYDACRWFCCNEWGATGGECCCPDRACYAILCFPFAACATVYSVGKAWKQSQVVDAAEEHERMHGPRRQLIE